MRPARTGKSSGESSILLLLLSAAAFLSVPVSWHFIGEVSIPGTWVSLGGNEFMVCEAALVKVTKQGLREIIFSLFSPAYL